jgi:phosphoribosylformylglycinamidine cyclo-ligase
VPLDDAERTFNMGIGMSVVVAADDADAVARQLSEAGEGVSAIGSIESGGEPVVMV